MHENEMMPQGEVQSEQGEGYEPFPEEEPDEEWLRRIHAARKPKRFRLERHSAFGSL